MKYTRFDIPFARWSCHVDGVTIAWNVPAHSVYVSQPWIHPRLRRRVHRRGRR